MYAHDSATVHTLEGLSEICRCLMGCPLTSTLLGLLLVGVQKHLSGTAGITAPDLRGILAPLLLYADDLLILMSTTLDRIQRQLDALACSCESTHCQSQQHQGDHV